MVARRNRKEETIIDLTASTPTIGVQYYQTSLKNSYNLTDGFASSIWPMGTNVSFHNTGTSTGGDFGELNKLNWDNTIELYTPGRCCDPHPSVGPIEFPSQPWRYAVSSSFLSSSVPVTGSGSVSTFSNGSEVISYAYTADRPNGEYGNATIFSESLSMFYSRK